MSTEQPSFQNEETPPLRQPVFRTTSKTSELWSSAAVRALNMSQSTDDGDDATDEVTTSDQVIAMQIKTLEGADRMKSVCRRRSSQKLLEDIHQSMK